MSYVRTRVASLSPARRRLLDQLLSPRPDVELRTRLDASALEPIKRACRQEYDGVTRALDATVFGEYSYFLNYGYVPDEETPQYAALALPEYCVNKNSVRLVLETIGDCPIDGQRVLDVGCGRGGTVAVLMQYFRPAHVDAVDLSSAAIAFCRRRHRHPDVRFDEADAECLPFAPASMGVVTNIESSSCYPTVGAFYREVWRVLRPGGWFLYTDCLPPERMQACLADLTDIGFVIVRDRDITQNVLRSCNEIASTRVGSYEATFQGNALASFVGAPGSPNYERLRTGRFTYRILTLRRPPLTEAM